MELIIPISAVSIVRTMVVNLPPVAPSGCGFSTCGRKKNPHNKRIGNVQSQMQTLMCKGPNKPPFNGILESLHKHFGISLARSSSIEVENSAKQYSDSLSQLNDVQLKPVSKSLKKLKKNVEKLFKDMSHCIEKMERDLGPNYKYEIDSNEVKRIKSGFDVAIKIVEAWREKINECQGLLMNAKKVAGKEKGYTQTVSIAVR
jgi:hypothetical protein